MKAVYTLDDLRDWSEPELCYAVLGDPVAHSASPAMQNAAFAAAGMPERYCRLHILPEQLLEAVALLPGAGFRGVNLTIPHKTQIIPFLNETDPHAALLGAVNTVIIREGRLIGHNTDGPGMVRAVLEVFGAKIGDLRVLVLGAGGGAGRAIATQCALEGCPRIGLVNRTLEKITLFADSLDATAYEWTEDSLRTALAETDLVINASSVGMSATDLSPIPAHLLRPELLVYDTIYVGSETPLQAVAGEVGAKSANGLSLLLHQGALAWELWTGQPAPLEAMRAALFTS